MASYHGIDPAIAKAAGLIDPVANSRPKKVSYGEQLVNDVIESERLQKIRDANLEAFVRQQTALGLPLPPSMTDEQAEKIESKIGRKLSDAEKTFGTLGRDDAPSLNDVFRPVAKPSLATMYDAEIAEAEALVEAERVSNMSEAQRTLYAMQQAKAEHVRKQQSADAMAVHLAKHADKIEWLEKVRGSAATNPQWTNEQLAVIDNALAQLRFGPDGDEATADKLQGDVKGIMFRHIQEEKENVAAKLRAAGVLTDKEIDDAIAKRFPDPTKGAPGDSALLSPVEAARKRYESLKARDDANKCWSTEQGRAFDEYLALDKAAEAAATEGGVSEGSAA